MRASSQCRIREGAEISILADSPQKPSLNIFRGLLYFFNRDKPGTVGVNGPRQVAASIRGTEFLFHVAEDETSTLTLLEGAVVLTNPLGTLELKTGEVGIVQPGQPPRPAPSIVATDPRRVQWFLYYPGVLAPDDLALPPEIQETIAPSLHAYSQGDLTAALATCPPTDSTDHPALRLYRAALLISNGQVTQAEPVLASLAEDARWGRLARALETIVAAVQFRAPAPRAQPSDPSLTGTEGLAFSFAAQSRTNLSAALAYAERACELAPDFGLAWGRVAELEFSFGRIAQAKAALTKARALAPRDAQATALEGFLFAAENRLSQARDSFEHAISLDAGLANAWLGRGLIRIRTGDVLGGRQDLQIAAAMEPQRAALRSYLGKALDAVGDTPKALHELGLAQGLDPRDPTAWLYAALIHQRQNRLNEAIQDLETSQALNQNRALYRSQLLLDQDRAVRSANLARVYEDAGLSEWSVREASRSVASDYANHSSHLFLAQSYLNADRVNLRLETARVSEFLLANLLAPPGAGVLSPALSQGEYGRLFERNGLGFVSQTDYASDGGWSLGATAYGNSAQTSFAIGGYREEDPGYRVNNQFLDRSVLAQYSQQISPKDTLYLQAGWSEFESGDLVEYYSPDWANPLYHQRESISPLLLAGWQHAWGPENRTLFLIGHAQQEVEVLNPVQPILALVEDRNGRPLTNLLGAIYEDLAQDYRLAAAEVQHIRQTERHTAVAGGRFQGGEITTEVEQGSNTLFPFPAFIPPGRSLAEAHVERWSLYAYHSWQATPWLQTIAGVAYDRLTSPLNYRTAPLSDEEDTTDQVSPKIGFVLTPWRDWVLRTAYTRSLGGVSMDQSLRLEPTQVAGLNQAYRSIMPESVVGVNSAATFETAQVALEYNPLPRTYLTASAEWLGSTADTHPGVYTGTPPRPPFSPSSPPLQPSLMREHLDYEERSLGLGLRQLMGTGATLGVGYRLSQAELESELPDLDPNLSSFPTHSLEESVLHQLNFLAAASHRTGFFGEFDAIWTHQSNHADLSAFPGDSFWQFHVFAGYRFWQRRAEVRLGLLNLTDQDYRLQPHNLYAGLTRERTFVTRLRLSF